MAPDSAIVRALAAWAEVEDYGQRVLSHLTIDRPCRLCDGSMFCSNGCPMALCSVDYEIAPHRREQRIREHEYRRVGDGWEEVLVQGTDCDLCTIYGQCLSCDGGRERRRARRKGSVYLVEGVPMYSVPLGEYVDPIRVTVAAVEKEIARRLESPAQQQFALGSAA